jgi:hypothetical protein
MSSSAALMCEFEAMDYAAKTGPAKEAGLD